MKKTTTLACAAITLVLVAGCGSSKNSTTSSSNAGAPAAPAASTSSTSSKQGPYGSDAAAGATGAAASALAVTTKHSKLGAILAAGPKRLTVYLFEADKGSTSACMGACASAWPPVTTSGSASAHGAALAGDLGAITRPDGTKQVTYKGHPLYYFSQDKDDGDAYGQGVKAFGAAWYVLAPSGSKVDES